MSFLDAKQLKQFILRIPDFDQEQITIEKKFWDEMRNNFMVLSQFYLEKAEKFLCGGISAVLILEVVDRYCDEETRVNFMLLNKFLNRRFCEITRCLKVRGFLEIPRFSIENPFVNIINLDLTSSYLKNGLLELYPNVRKLRVRDSSIVNHDSVCLEQISQLKYLEDLNIVDYTVRPPEYSHIFEMTSLTSLSGLRLPNKEHVTDDFKEILKLTNLKKLEMRFYVDDDFTFLQLAQMKIEELYLTCKFMKVTDWSKLDLEKFKMLKIKHFKGVDISDISIFYGLVEMHATLTHLTLIHTSMSDWGAFFILFANFTFLELLSVTTRRYADVNDLSFLINVHTVVAKNFGFPVGCIQESFLNMPKLRNLTLFNIVMPQEEFADLARLNLKRFEIFHEDGEDGWAENLIKSVSKISTLQELKLSIDNMTPKISKYISRMKNLQKISLDKFNLQGDISFLSKAPKLREVNIISEDLWIADFKYFNFLQRKHNHITFNLSKS